MRATDRDAGTNAAVTYSITSGDDSQKKFRIDRNSGITLLKLTLFVDI